MERDHGGKFCASAFTETPKAKTATEFLAISGRALSAKGRPELPRPFARILQHAFCFIQGRFHESWDQRGAARANVFALYGRERSTRFTRREKATFVAQGVFPKIFELAKPANVSLWTNFRAISPPEVKEKIAREVEVVAEPEGALSFSPNCIGTIGLCFFQKVLCSNDGGNLIEGCKAHRHRAASPCSVALHLTVSQSGASRKWLREIFQEMTGTVQRICATLNAPGLPTPLRSKWRRHYYSQMTAAAKNAARSNRRHFATRFASRYSDQKFQTDRRIRAA